MLPQAHFITSGLNHTYFLSRFSFFFGNNCYFKGLKPIPSNMKNFIRYTTLILIGVAISVTSLNGQKKKKDKT